MGNPRIVYDGTTLDFPQPASPGTDFRPDSDRDQALSDGGIHATTLRRWFMACRLVVAQFTDAEFERKLMAWWSWAVRGKQYAVALDSAEVADTTLDGTAAAGQAVIPLTATTGITVGKQYLVREAAGDEFEVIEVQSISAGVSVTATANLKYGYASGDVFRARDYVPKVVSPSGRAPWGVSGPTAWTFDHAFEEDFA